MLHKKRTESGEWMDSQDAAMEKERRTVFEIINPSDPYSLVAEEKELAAAACLVLGGGAYSLDEVGGEWRMPLFLLADEEAVQEWWREEFGKSVEETLENAEGVAAVLRTVMIGNPKDRNPLTMPDEEEHDEKRTSINDIGAKAWKMADNLESD